MCAEQVVVHSCHLSPCTDNSLPVPSTSNKKKEEMNAKRQPTLSLDEINDIISKRLSSNWGKRRTRAEFSSLKSSKPLRIVPVRGDLLSCVNVTNPIQQHELDKVMYNLHRRIEAVESNVRTQAPDWRDVQERIISHPSEVMQLDSRGRTGLAHACTKACLPLDILETLLDHSHFGSETSRDKNGKTALHIAIQSQCQLPIIEGLCKFRRRQRRFTKSIAMTMDHHGELPLHAACTNKYRHDTQALVKILLEYGPEAAAVENTRGKTPLHIALENKVPIDIIRILVDGMCVNH